MIVITCFKCDIIVFIFVISSPLVNKKFLGMLIQNHIYIFVELIIIYKYIQLGYNNKTPYIIKIK